MRIFWHTTFRVLILCGLGGGTLGASAFQLDDHKRVTLQAVAEFLTCFPKYAAVLRTEALVQGNLDEDTNLFNKELFYSHFYNPEKKLSLLWRDDSSGRIENLRPDLLQCRQSTSEPEYSQIVELGHAIHHFQDMAVPAHVVPVNHSLWDGFESFALSGDISSEWTCAQIGTAAGDDLQNILKETAQGTLQAVRALHVEADMRDSELSVALTGASFWEESADDSFGQYGSAGNNFGSYEFEVNGDAVVIHSDYASMFKRQQMKLAVRATLRGLAWVLH